MFTLRCTRKLLAKLGRKPDPAAPAPTTCLGDWYANTLNLGSERFVLLVSERTRIPVIVPAAQAREQLAGRLREGLRATLAGIGVTSSKIDEELEQMSSEPAISNATNRSVLGWMNDVAFHATIRRKSHPAISALELGLELADMPCVSAHLIPNDATLIAFGDKEPRPPTPRRVPKPPPPQLPPALKKQLRKLAAIAHEREMRAALMQLDSGFTAWKADRIYTGELLDLIHRFHDGIARDLYSLYVLQKPGLAVQMALENGVLSEAETGAEVLAHFRWRR